MLLLLHNGLKPLSLQLELYDVYLYSSWLWEPQKLLGALHRAQEEQVPSCQPCSLSLQQLNTADYETKQKRSSFNWTSNWCKDQRGSKQNTTWKRTIQSIKQMLYFPYLEVQMQRKGSNHWNQHPIWQEPGFLPCFISEMLYSSHVWGVFCLVWGFLSHSS